MIKVISKRKFKWSIALSKCVKCAFLQSDFKLFSTSSSAISSMMSFMAKRKNSRKLPNIWERGSNCRILPLLDKEIDFLRKSLNRFLVIGIFIFLVEKCRPTKVLHLLNINCDWPAQEGLNNGKNAHFIDNWRTQLGKGSLSKLNGSPQIGN